MRAARWAHVDASLLGPWALLGKGFAFSLGHSLSDPAIRHPRVRLTATLRMRLPRLTSHTASLSPSHFFGHLPHRPLRLIPLNFWRAPSDAKDTSKGTSKDTSGAPASFKLPARSPSTSGSFPLKLPAPLKVQAPQLDALVRLPANSPGTSPPTPGYRTL